MSSSPQPIPRDSRDSGRGDMTPERVAERQRYVETLTGASLQHVRQSTIPPAELCANIENLIGAAQIPLGIAGPLLVNGEHAKGSFLVPLATTEGTLVASYNRGMKVLSLAGGVTTTVSADAMQRAPVFIFDSARQARDFVDWMFEHLDDIRRVAEATSHVARLLRIEPFLSNKFAFARFNFSTGDAAGQNMVGKATRAAYRWILANNPTIRQAYLEANMATEKKPSHVNVMHPRGKRVTAEATIPRAVLRKHLRVEPEAHLRLWSVANIGAMLAGTNNNGLHCANALTALFIATGQDVANVAEGTPAAVYVELTPGGDLYFSITLPSLIVATHGGGTHLPTQRECLAILGCNRPGSANKFAEIVAATVLAGEVSLAAALLSDDWVAAHEKLGRNR